METAVAVAHCRFEELPVEHITLDLFILGAAKPAHIAAGPEESFDLVAPCDQFVDEISSDKA
jgi:hypothetical protein